MVGQKILITLSTLLPHSRLAHPTALEHQLQQALLHLALVPRLLAPVDLQHRTMALLHIHLLDV